MRQFGAPRPEIQRLLAATRVMSHAEREEQVISFAYGNAKIEEARITRPLVERAAADMERE